MNWVINTAGKFVSTCITQALFVLRVRGWDVIMSVCQPVPVFGHDKKYKKCPRKKWVHGFFRAFAHLLVTI